MGPAVWAAGWGGGCDPNAGNGAAWSGLLLKPVPVLHVDQAAEIARLKRENERLRMERDILKKGIAIFANPSR